MYFKGSMNEMISFFKDNQSWNVWPIYYTSIIMLSDYLIQLSNYLIKLSNHLIQLSDYLN